MTFSMEDVFTSMSTKCFFIDAQTLDASARLTNILFTADLQNSSSQAYKNLTASIIEEVSVFCGLSSDRTCDLNRAFVLR